MTLKLSKVRGHADQYVFTYDNGTKVVSWAVNGNDVDTETLTDVVDTVHPALAPTIPAIPLFLGEGMSTAHTDWLNKHTLPSLPNTGAEAADKAAREEEMRLRNGGAALAKGIGMAFDDVPVFEDGNIPEVNWGV